MANFSLSWDSYKNTICSGLSALQQNGEFVDMTLAADGHHVKVHQLVMSLVSPFIKDIITSTQCAHPVIFLNKISYTTLCAILEYIYTGEVTIAKDSLPDLVQAARELCIKGLENMKYELKSEAVSQTIRARNNNGHSIIMYKELENLEETAMETLDDDHAKDMEQSEEEDQNNENIADQSIEMESNDADGNSKIKSVLPSKTGLDTQIQYSMSPQGSLQMIMNRYLYHLKYTSRKGADAGHRLWKCASYPRALRCPATVVTQGGAVIRRMQAHNHPFHDRAILRKVRQSTIFTALNEDELQELVKNKGKLNPPAVDQNKNTEDDTE